MSDCKVTYDVSRDAYHVELRIAADVMQDKHTRREIELLIADQLDEALKAGVPARCAPPQDPGLQYRWSSDPRADGVLRDLRIAVERLKRDRDSHQIILDNLKPFDFPRPALSAPEQLAGHERAMALKLNGGIVQSSAQCAHNLGVCCSFCCASHQYHNQTIKGVHETTNWGRTADGVCVVCKAAPGCAHLDECKQHRPAVDALFSTRFNAGVSESFRCAVEAAKALRPAKCVCGTDKAGGGIHSAWCEKAAR